MTLTRRQIGELLAAHGLAPSRALGQNFVVDPNTVRRIARLADVGSGDRVVEIGPGLGSLTLALAETGASVTAVETDRYLVPVLGEVLAGAGVGERVRIVHADAMTVDWTELLHPAGGPPVPDVPDPAAPASSGRGDPNPTPAVLDPTSSAPAGGWVLVANLPYNVATPLVAELLDGVPAIERMLVMVQREVAERLAAGPGAPGYGAVSVKVAYWAEVRIVGRVPATVFYPQPKVESALVDIRRRSTPAVDPAEASAEALFALVRAGFATRRKMLRRALAGSVSTEAFAAAGVAPEARAEDLDIHAWGRLVAAAR